MALSPLSHQLGGDEGDYEEEGLVDSKGSLRVHLIFLSFEMRRLDQLPISQVNPCASLIQARQRSKKCYSTTYRGLPDLRTTLFDREQRGL